jgi:CheY-like chemotaxis protein
LPNELHITVDGYEALQFLNKEEPFHKAPRPDIVLLDLNMPRKDGRQVLKEIKETPVLKNIPVIVLTSSSSEADIIESYGLHANAYIVKPVSWDSFLQAILTIEDFWLDLVALSNE